MKYKVIDLFQGFSDFLKYDLLHNSPPIMPPIKMDLQFHTYVEDGVIWAVSKDYPGLEASGKTPEELREALFEMILLHFDVPRYRAKRIPDTLSLRLSDGTIVPPPEPVFRARLVSA